MLQRWCFWSGRVVPDRRQAARAPIFEGLVTLLDRREDEDWLRHGMEMLYDVLATRWMAF